MGVCSCWWGSGHITTRRSTPSISARSPPVPPPFRVQGAGCRVQGAGCRVEGARFRVQGAGFRVSVILRHEDVRESRRPPSRRGLPPPPPRSGFRVQSAGFRVQGAGFGVQGAGLRVHGSGCRVQGSGFRVQGSGHTTTRRCSRWSTPSTSARSPPPLGALQCLDTLQSLRFEALFYPGKVDIPPLTLYKASDVKRCCTGEGGCM